MLLDPILIRCPLSLMKHRITHNYVDRQGAVMTPCAKEVHYRKTTPNCSLIQNYPACFRPHMLKKKLWGVGSKTGRALLKPWCLHYWTVWDGRGERGAGAERGEIGGAT